MLNSAFIQQYSAEIFLEWEIFRSNLTVKTETRTFCPAIHFQKLCRLWDKVQKKRDTAREATDGNATGRMRFP